MPGRFLPQIGGTLEVTMSKFITLIAAAAVSVALAAPALAREEGHHDRDVHDREFYHHDFHGGVFLYDPFYAYPYAQSGYWYFCPTANGYYPSIPSCPVPWQLVPVR
jgi:hypothetical protein